MTRALPQPSTSWQLLVRSLSLAAVILIIAAVAAYGISRRLGAEYYRYKADRMLEQNHLGLAAQALNRATHFLPLSPDLYKSLASVYQKMGQATAFDGPNLRWATKAKETYAHAFRLNPLDAEAALGVALAESRLQTFQRTGAPQDRSGAFDARPYFESALALRPSGIPIHFALIRHLDRMEDRQGLIEAVERLCRLYPAAYESLRKKAYWGPLARNAARRGVQEAVIRDRSSVSALRVLSAVAAEEGRWDLAADAFEKTLGLASNSPTEAQYRKLGSIYLRAGRVDGAEERFTKSLSLSQNRVTALVDIYRIYSQAGRGDAFPRLHDRVNRRFPLPNRAGIVLAQAHLKNGETASARRILENLNAIDATAEGWYWLFRVAEAEKNTDRMELALQRATVLDPKNTEYRRRFIDLLKRLGKYRSAEAQIDRLMTDGGSQTAALFEERADLRRRLGDFAGAAEDRMAAARLLPARAEGWAKAGEALIEAGNWRSAREAYRKAVKLSPKNSRYQEQLRRLGAGE